MFTEIVSWAAVGLALAASATILINRDWRILLGSLAIQYLAVFWLVTRHLPIAMASVKLIAGWMSVAILGMTRLSHEALDQGEQDRFFPRGAVFRILLIGIVILIAIGGTPRIESATPGMGLPVLAAGLLLIGAGIAHLGVTSDILRVIIGLLTMLSGFEIIYAAVESAILVTGLLAVVTLGLGVIGAYLQIAGSVPLVDSDTEDIV